MQTYIGCQRCNGTGSVIAYLIDKPEPYAYGFRCDCSAGLNKKSSLPIYPANGRWVLASEDSGLTDDYVYSMIKAGLKDDHRFKLRLSIWGKERFRASYERVKKREDSKALKEVAKHDASKVDPNGDSGL